MAILARRHRTPHGEIDLIARDGEALVFVEVKGRPSRALAAGAIGARQRRRLGEAALHYAAETGQAACPLRFDVVTVDAAGRAERIANALTFDGW